MTNYYALARKIISRYATAQQKTIIARDDMVVSKVVDSLIEADSTYDPNQLSSPKTWRWKAAIRAIINNTKMKKINLTSLDSLSPEQKRVLSKKAIDKYNHITEQCDNADLLANLLGKTPLTKTQKKYLRMYYLEGKNTKQIGLKFGCSKQAVQQRLQSAIVKLRKTANQLQLKWSQ